MSTSTMETIGWVTGLISCFLGWSVWFIIALLAASIILIPVAAVILLVPLILSIIALTREDKSPRAVQGLLMILFGPVLGWFGFLLLLVGRSKKK